jgi:hypothetical protein
MKIVTGLQNKVMQTSRQKKLDHFYSLFEEGMTVLDVGVSSELRRGIPSRNYFLKNFRYASRFYTGLGVQDLGGMEALFPGKRFLQYPGGRFPFLDKEFDWAFSNAVIEHVGNGEAQLFFLNEMLRVASNVFFTTPNKYFPLEPHTNALFLHWNDSIFYQWCRKQRKRITKDTLCLFSYRRLERLLYDSHASHCQIYKNRFLGLSMTFTVTCTAL